MNHSPSRRSLLTAGLGLPALAAQQRKPVSMERRTLGKTGLKVSPLGFGGRGTSEAGVIQRAFDLGVNYFDTGRTYANNERLIGTALKGKRQEVIINSKTSAATRKEA
ncbi:MAG: aldo/keto reductase, partial [Chloroflexota bacterium]